MLMNTKQYLLEVILKKTFNHTLEHTRQHQYIKFQTRMRPSTLITREVLQIQYRSIISGTNKNICPGIEQTQRTASINVSFVFVCHNPQKGTIIITRLSMMRMWYNIQPCLLIVTLSTTALLVL